jgi:predicted ABC-type sugar transport system permease subunit
MEILLQQIINGLVQGSVYALVALGYTMVYGILGLINFAHGEVVMIGAMLALSALTALLGMGVSALLALPLSIVLAMAGCMALGYSIERIAYRPLRHAPRLAPLITAIGVSIVLQNLAMMIWGRSYHSFPQLIANDPHNFGGAIINDIQIIIFILAVAIMVGLMMIVHRTRLGRAMRAVAENQHAAQLMGVDIQPRDLDHLHAGFGACSDSGNNGQRQLWVGALLHGIFAWLEGFHRSGIGWDRQSARRNVWRIVAWLDRKSGRGLYRGHDRRIHGQQLSGCVRLLRADRRSGI